MASSPLAQQSYRPCPPQEPNLAKLSAAGSIGCSGACREDAIAAAATTASLDGVCAATLDSLPGIDSLDSLPSIFTGCHSLESLPVLESESEPDQSSDGDYCVEKERWGMDAMNQFGYEVGELIEEVSWASNQISHGSICFLRRARCTASNRQVIVKTISSTTRPTQLQRQELLAEFRLLRGLKHPSVIGAKGFMETEFDSWMILDWGGADTVQSVIDRNGPLSELHAKTLFAQLLQGLQYVHKQGIIHAGVRPANLLLHGATRTLKIANFSGARQIGFSGPIAEHDEHLDDQFQSSTTLYQAPEMLFRRDGNERSDIWAAGLSMYYKTHSSLPFDIREAKVSSHLRLGYLPRVSLRGGISLLIQSLITQCLTVDALCRPTASSLLMHPALDTSSE